MKKYLIGSAIVALLFSACETLEENVYSELTPRILNTEEGALSLLLSSYSSSSLVGMGNGGVQYHFLSSMPSGETWNEGGNIEASLGPLTNFTWDSNLDFFDGAWTHTYAAIRDANILIRDLPSSNLPEAVKKQFIAEASFVRGFSYNLLYNWFGPVPLVTAETEEYYLPKATQDEIQAFIEADLSYAAEHLSAHQPDFGRATKGAALGLLTKFYLNTKQWKKSADMAYQIMALGEYSLLPDYSEVFSLENEGNEELLWVLTRNAQGGAQFINALTFPTDYPLLPNQGVYAARTYLGDEFVLSFEESDVRKEHIVKEYVNIAGQRIQLLGNNKSLSLKYEFDPKASGPGMGNDIPVVRYSDILLSLAEALNELQGPHQESIDLINQVRGRAHASLLSLDGHTKDSLREHIYKEREWEFFSEGKRREDQIRLGTFISKAVLERNKNAQAHHVLFPIPETELNTNSNLVQNDGY